MVNDLNLLIRIDFFTVAIFLSIIGAILKYRTPCPNKLIPTLLFGIAFFVCSVWGYFSSFYIGGARLVDALLMCGLIQGVVVSAIATWGWDVVYGIYKVGFQRNKKEGK